MNIKIHPVPLHRRNCYPVHPVHSFQGVAFPYLPGLTVSSLCLSRRVLSKWKVSWRFSVMFSSCWLRDPLSSSVEQISCCTYSTISSLFRSLFRSSCPPRKFRCQIFCRIFPDMSAEGVILLSAISILCSECTAAIFLLLKHFQKMLSFVQAMLFTICNSPRI